MNRRDFITHGIGLAGIIAAGRAPAAIVKNILGAVGTSYINEDAFNPTTIDYVQNGLIAMWDGIENVGRGEHDTNAIIWRDLSDNNHNLSLPLNAQINDDSVFLGLDADCGTDDISSSDYVACEAVFKIANNSAVFASPKGKSGYTTENKKTINVINNYMVLCSDFPGSGNGKGTAGTYNNTKMQVSVEWLGDYNPSSLRINGSEKNLVTTSGRSWFIAPYYFSIVPHLVWQGQRFGSGQIYNIRLYSHKLSPLEKAWNYKIDKARFGL
jgi:hypothetical protein